jgi:hypothetical protein
MASDIAAPEAALSGLARSAAPRTFYFAETFIDRNVLGEDTLLI